MITITKATTTYKSVLQWSKSSGALVVVAILGNILNYVYNAYLSRKITLEDFGLISLIGSFLFLSSIPLDSLARAITHKSAYFLGKYNFIVKEFWTYIRGKSLIYGIATFVIWIVATPFLSQAFKVNTIFPFLVFSPVWFLGILLIVDRSFLSGSHKFNWLALSLIIEPITKILTTILLVNFGLTHLAYAAIPLSIFIAFVISYWLVSKIKFSNYDISDSESRTFPTKFFMTSTLINFAAVAYLSFDMILVKYFLTSVEAGQYALIALIGKMIYFVGKLFSQFLVPLTSKEEGAQKSSKLIFLKIMGLTSAVSFIAFIAVGPLGYIFAPILLGEKIIPLLSHLSIYGFGMLCFVISSLFIGYSQIKSWNIFPVLSFILAIFQIIAISMFHANLGQVVLVMSIIGVSSLILTSSLYLGSFLFQKSYVKN